MESVLGRVVVMVAVGVVGGALAIMLVRAEAHARHSSSASKVVLESSRDPSANVTRDISQCKSPFVLLNLFSLACLCNHPLLICSMAT